MRSVVIPARVGDLVSPRPRRWKLQKTKGGIQGEKRKDGEEAEGRSTAKKEPEAIGHRGLPHAQAGLSDLRP